MIGEGEGSPVIGVLVGCNVKGNPGRGATVAASVGLELCLIKTEVNEDGGSVCTTFIIVGVWVVTGRAIPGRGTTGAGEGLEVSGTGLAFIVVVVSGSVGSLSGSAGLGFDTTTPSPFAKVTVSTPAYCSQEGQCPSSRHSS